MLLLSRLPNESIIIDHPAGPISVKIMKVEGEKVKLGIEGPKSIAVHRKEIWDRIKLAEQQIRVGIAEGVPLNVIEDLLDAGENQP